MAFASENLLGELEDFFDNIQSDADAANPAPDSSGGGGGFSNGGFGNGGYGNGNLAGGVFGGGRAANGSSGGYVGSCGTGSNDNVDLGSGFGAVAGNGTNKQTMTAATKAALGEHLRIGAEKRKMEEGPGLAGFIGGDDSSSSFPKAQKLDQDASLFEPSSVGNGNFGPPNANVGCPADSPGLGGGAGGKAGTLLAQALMEKKGPRSQATTLNARSPYANSSCCGPVGNQVGPVGGVAKGPGGGQERPGSEDPIGMRKLNEIIRNKNLDGPRRTAAISKLVKEHPLVYRILQDMKRRGQMMNGGGSFFGDQQQGGGGGNNNNPRMMASNGFENNFDQQQQGAGDQWGGPQKMHQGPRGFMGQQQFGGVQQQQQQMGPGGPMFQNGPANAMDPGMWGGNGDPQQQFAPSAAAPGPKGRGGANVQGPPPSYPYGGRGGGPRFRPAMHMGMQQQQMYQNDFMMNGPQQQGIVPGGYGGPRMAAGGGDFHPRMGQGFAGPANMMMQQDQMFGGEFMGQQQQQPGMMIGRGGAGGPMGMRHPMPGPMSPAAARMQMGQQQFQMKQQQQLGNGGNDFLMPGSMMGQQQQQPGGFQGVGGRSFGMSDPSRMNGGMAAPANPGAGSFDGSANGRAMQQGSFDDRGIGMGDQQQQQDFSWRSSPAGQQHRVQLRSRLQEAVQNGLNSLAAEAERVEQEAFSRCETPEAYSMEIAKWLAGVFQQSDGQQHGGGGASSGDNMSNFNNSSNPTSSSNSQELNAAGDHFKTEEPAEEDNNADMFSSASSPPAAPSSSSFQQGERSPVSSSSTRLSLSEQNPILSKLLPAGGGGGVGSPSSVPAAAVTSPAAPSSSDLDPRSCPSGMVASPPPPSTSAPLEATTTSTSSPSSDTPSSCSPASSVSGSAATTTTPSSSSAALKSSPSSSAGDAPFQSPTSFPVPSSVEETRSPMGPAGGQAAQRGARRASGKSAPVSAAPSSAPNVGSGGSLAAAAASQLNNNPYSVDSGFGSPRSNTSSSLCSPKIQGTSPSLAPAAENSPEK